jgi:hypothetical protein
MISLIEYVTKIVFVGGNFPIGQIIIFLVDDCGVVVDSHVVVSSSYIFNFLWSELGKSRFFESLFLTLLVDGLAHDRRIVAFFAEDRMTEPAHLENETWKGQRDFYAKSRFVCV